MLFFAFWFVVVCLPNRSNKNFELTSGTSSAVTTSSCAIARACSFGSCNLTKRAAMRDSAASRSLVAASFCCVCSVLVASDRFLKPPSNARCATDNAWAGSPKDGCPTLCQVSGFAIMFSDYSEFADTYASMSAADFWPAYRILALCASSVL